MNSKTILGISIAAILAIASVSVIGIQDAVADGNKFWKYFKYFSKKADFVAKADSAQTNPPSPDFGNSAMAKLSFDKDLSKLQYTIKIAGLDLNSEVTKIHIHEAPPTVMGAHVLNLFGGPCAADLEMSYLGTTGVVTGAWDDQDKNTEERICAVPPDPDANTDGGDTDLLSEKIEALCDGNLYVNIHSTNFPQGELRGQIEPTKSGQRICDKLGFD